MKSAIKKTIRILLTPLILGDYFRYKKELRGHESRFTLRLRDFHPQVKDKTITTGFDRHYVYHTSWAARIVAETKPVKHIDISSSLYFSGIVSAFVPVEFYDYRPANLLLSNLESKEGNLLSLSFETGSVASLSCMHTVEHVGLGRYGDSIDPDGDKKACAELSRVLAPGGSLIFVTPVGRESMIEFNAHRIYSYEAVLGLFPNLELKEFSLIPESEKDGGLVRNADKNLVVREKYACGCFHFTKK